MKDALGYIYYLLIWVSAFIIGFYAANSLIISFLSIYIKCDLGFSLFLKLLFAALTFKSLKVLLPLVLKETK